MTAGEAKQKFDFRWLVLTGALTVLASVSLLRLSWASVGFTALVLTGVIVNGVAARRLLDHEQATLHFLYVQRLRMCAITLIMPCAAYLVRSNRALLMIVAAIALWLVSVSSFLQIGARYMPAQIKFLSYVQYIGDFWVALFLAIWGADWLIVAGVLAMAAPSANAAVQERDPRLLPVVVISAAALFLFGIPPTARWFAVYVIATIALSAWSAHHLVLLATHLRSLTASASDGSTIR